jgi:hypothetical protein
MTRAPALRPLVGGDVGSILTGRRTLLGVAACADPHDLIADLDAEHDDEDDAMRRAIQELPCRRDTEGTSLGGSIPSTG